MAPPSSEKFLGWGEAALAAAAADTGVRVHGASAHLTHTRHPWIAKSGCSFHRHHGGTRIFSQNDSNDRRGNSQRSAAYSGCAGLEPRTLARCTDRSAAAPMTGAKCGTHPSGAVRSGWAGQGGTAYQLRRADLLPRSRADFVATELLLAATYTIELVRDV